MLTLLGNRLAMEGNRIEKALFTLDSHDCYPFRAEVLDVGCLLDKESRFTRKRVTNDV